MKVNKPVALFVLGALSLAWGAFAYVSLFFPSLFSIVAGSTALGFFLGGFLFCVYAVYLVRRKSRE